MAYFCLCGHKRGIHEDPLKDYPGKCGIKECGCSKYNSKLRTIPWSEKPVFLREFYYQLGLWVLGSLFCISFLDSNIPQLALLPLVPVAVITTIFWFHCLNPFVKIHKENQLEK